MNPIMSNYKRFYLVAYTLLVDEGRAVGLRKVNALDKDDARDQVRAYLDQTHPTGRNHQYAITEAARLKVL